MVVLSQNLLEPERLSSMSFLPIRDTLNWWNSNQDKARCYTINDKLGNVSIRHYCTTVRPIFHLIQLLDNLNVRTKQDPNHFNWSFGLASTLILAPTTLRAVPTVYNSGTSDLMTVTSTENADTSFIHPSSKQMFLSCSSLCNSGSIIIRIEETTLDSPDGPSVRCQTVPIGGRLLWPLNRCSSLLQRSSFCKRVRNRLFFKMASK